MYFTLLEILSIIQNEAYFTFKMVFGLKLEGPTANNISDPNSNEDNSSTFRTFSNASSVYSSCKNH